MTIKLQAEVDTLTFDLKKQELVRLTSPLSVLMPRLRRSPSIGRTDRSTHVMPAFPKDHYLPTSTTYRPTSPNQTTELKDWTATMPRVALRQTRGRAVAERLPILIARTLTTDFTPLWPGRVPEADEEGVVVVPRVPLDSQDDILAAEELLHVHKNSPSQRKGVAMKTSD